MMPSAEAGPAVGLSPAPQSSLRRHDIDWLRVILFGILIWYHYQYFSPPYHAVLDSTPLRLFLDIVHQWRLAALFAISGMGTAFAFKRRTWRAYLKERAARLLVPLLFATYILLGLTRLLHPIETTRRALAIFPAADVSPFGHLWFLYNLLIYSLALTPLFVYVRRKPDGRFVGFIRELLNARYGAGVMLLPPLLLALAGILTKPWRAGTLGMWWEFAWYFLFFGFGYLLLVGKEEYFSLLDRLRMPVTILTPILAIAYYASREWLGPPDVMTGGWFLAGYPAFSLAATLATLVQAFHAWFWCLFLFSWAAKLLNRPSGALTYLNRAIYPVYIVHLQFVQLVVLLIGEEAINPFINSLFLGPLLVAPGCLVIFEIVKRARFARLVFGIKPLPRPNPGGLEQGTPIGHSIL
ncbi:MAG: acyltransferase family protein, partial [Chloroflexota bacterium]